MSLQFIVGSAGSGKSTYLYKQVVNQAIQNPKKNYLVVVPEQFTMHTQQQLVSMHPAHSIMNIDILSFERMAYRVFDELGTDTLEVLEETGKHLLLRKISQEKEDSLEVLSKNIKKPGYIAQVKSLISEFMQYDISPETVEQMLEQPMMSEGFKRKTKDVLTLYREYKNRLEGNYITAEEILQKLMDVAEQSELLKDAWVVFDGFTGFTPLQNQFLQILLTLAEKVMVTVTCDPGESLFRKPQEEELFSMSKEMVLRLEKMARMTGVELEDTVFIGKRHTGRFLEGGYLEHLEKNLFRPGGKAYKPGEGIRDKIELISLANTRQELSYVACDIENQVRTDGLRYRDFAVVCADMDAYAHLVPEIFDKLHIPYFLDLKTQVLFQPFVESIKALFVVVEENFSYEGILRLLRTGMTDLSMEETDLLENYILAANVRGKSAYVNPFLFMPMGYTGEQMVRLNEIREKFIRPIRVFSDTFPAGRGTAKEISTALYQWICYYGMETKLLQKKEAYEKLHKESKAKEYDQIYGVVMGLLDKLVGILGREEMTLEEYGELLSTGFESMGIGVIPPENDVVMIGDMERSRLSDVKVLYLVGARDGAIPKSATGGGILSQTERQQLKEARFELAPSDREKVFMQRFYLYLVMTKPSEKLVVTYGRIDGSGKATRRSYLIGVLEHLFPTVSLKVLENLPGQWQMMTPELGEDFLVNGLREYVQTGERPEELIAFLCWEKAHRRERMNRWLEAVYFRHEKEMLSPDATKAVFPDGMSESVSRLEQYARCAYAYFVRYGLEFLPRQEYSFARIDMGNLYHTALEYYSVELQKRQDVNWYTISEEQMRSLLEKAIVHSYETITKTQVFSQARDAYVLHRMEQTLHQTVWVLTEQVRKGSFVPTDFEVDFAEVGDLKSMNLQLDEMHTMKLRGKIDRMDLYQSQGSVYVKIVDYKSGQKDLDFNQLYNGLQVQLVLYMNAAIEGLKKKFPGQKVEPGAMFYYHIHRPLVDMDMVQKTSREEAILKFLQMKGVLNRDPKIIEAMDHGLSGKSSVIPVGYKKDGTLDATSSAISGEEFSLMEQYVDMILEKTGRALFQGEIDCKPYKMGQKNGCEYCDYQGICGFDTKIPGYEYRWCRDGLKRDEVLEKMEMELEAYRGQKKQKGGERDDQVDQRTTEGH